MAEADQLQPEGQLQAPEATPKKRLRSSANSRSPSKPVGDDHADETPSKRRVSPRKKPTPSSSSSENVNDTIRSILANMAPPTEEEIRETRVPKAAPTSAETETSPAKTDTDTGVKLFPIFGPGFSAKSPGSAKKKRKCQLPMTSTTTDDGKSGLKQAIIDAGQKKIGAELCLLCDFVYTVGDPVVRSH